MKVHQIEVQGKDNRWVALSQHEFKTMAEIEAEHFRCVTTSEVRIVPVESPLLAKIRSL